ncbi:hypothetical protein NEOKW01_0971 [Nematocida sp. AWRm80]|nr:hypothetical protein NEOKW01_0971 [Nematocida sp. AWRm80]
MSRVQVAVRIRPLSAEEKKKGEKSCWCKIGDKAVIQHLNQEGSEVSSYAMYFDWVFNEDNTNRDVFMYLLHSVSNLFNNNNVCIITYGQTSSGKTYTMKGDRSYKEYLSISPETESNRLETYKGGIIPSSIFYIFKCITDHKVYISYTEVYNECIYDLLGDPHASLQVREKAGGEVKIPGLNEIEIKTQTEALETLQRAESNRRIASTKMNRHSSRSHIIIKIRISNRNTASTLTLVDLAGSERSKEAQTKDTRLKEGSFINKSLLALSTVISKLSTNQGHIPFRNTKLTRILQPSLTVNSDTILICNISPTKRSIEESISTLNLANVSKNIQLKKISIPTQLPRTNTKPFKEALFKLSKELKDLKEVLLETATELEQIEEISNKETKAIEQESIITNCISNYSQILKEVQLIRTTNLNRLTTLSQSITELKTQEKYLQKTLSTHKEEIQILLEELKAGDTLITRQRKEIEYLRAKENKIIKASKTASDPLANPQKTLSPTQALKSTMSQYTSHFTTHTNTHLTNSRSNTNNNNTLDSNNTLNTSSPSISLALELDRIKKMHQKEKRILSLKIQQLERRLLNSSKDSYWSN